MKIRSPFGPMLRHRDPRRLVESFRAERARKRAELEALLREIAAPAASGRACAA